VENGGCRLYKCVYACVCSGGQGGGFSVYVSARTHGNHVFVHVLQERKGLGLWGIRRKCARARATAGGAKGTVQGGSIFSSSFINLYILDAGERLAQATTFLQDK